MAQKCVCHGTKYPLSPLLFLVIKVNNAIVTKSLSADTNNEDLRNFNKNAKIEICP